MFAKLFESDRFGQILVVMDRGDDGPQVTFSVEPTNLGVCSMAPGFDDTDEGWDRAEKLLTECDQAMAEKMAASIFSAAGVAASNSGGAAS